MDTLQVLDIAGFVCGLAYLYLEYRASIYLWIASVIMPAVDMFLYYEAGLYADFGMAIYYCLAAVYGFLVWKYGRKHGQEAGSEMPVTHFRRSLVIPAAACFALAWLIIYWVLTRFTNSSVPVTDSFTTALSVVALWALARKYAEQWLLWLVVDVVCCVLYVYKDIPFKAAIYGLYTVVAVFGYRKWRRMIVDEA